MNTAADKVVPNAKLVGGVWLPEDERHFVYMMLENKKAHRVVDGKATYQYRKLEAAMKNIPRERRRRCVDIGAYTGLWAMWLAKEFAFVECFEPMPYAEILPHNMPSDNYALHRIALGEEPGVVAMGYPDGVVGNCHVLDSAKARACGIAKEVAGIEMRTLDSFAFEEVDFIKIDVEGFELQVVKGAKETLLRNRPYMILEQKGNDEKFEGQKRNEALRWCQRLGMVPRWEIGGDWFLSW